LRINEGKARNFRRAKQYVLLRRKNKDLLITFPLFLRSGVILFLLKKNLKKAFFALRKHSGAE